MPWWGWLLIAWLPIGIPLGMVLGRYMRGVSRHYPVAAPQAPRPPSTGRGYSRSTTVTCSNFVAMGGVCTSRVNCPFIGRRCEGDFT